MAFKPEDIEANRAFFAAKLRAEKQKNDLIHKVKDGEGEPFLLLDVRPRAAFRRSHIQGRGACRTKSWGRSRVGCHATRSS